MNTSNYNILKEYASECLKTYKFSVDKVKYYHNILYTLSDLKKFKKLFVEYIEFDDSLSFTFNIGYGIMFNITYYPNNEIYHSISVDGKPYRIGTDLTDKELIERLNKALDFIDKWGILD